MIRYYYVLHMQTTSMMAYSAQLGTTTTLATIQGLIGAAYYGMGRGAGTFIGGFLMKWFTGDSIDKTVGTRATFRVLGIAAAVTAVFYFLFNIFYIRRRANGKGKGDDPVPPAAVGTSNGKEGGGLNNPVFVSDSDHQKEQDHSITKAKSIN